jgi:hypothetical protein
MSAVLGIATEKEALVVSKWSPRDIDVPVA